jgi:hypothetical protein
MLGPEVGQAAVRITVFLMLVSGALLCFQQPGTAEFVVTVTTLAISSAFLLLIVALIKRSQR